MIAESQRIAVVGMSARLPGARDVAQFWQNLRDGVESVTFFTDQVLRAHGVPAEMLAHPDYVRAAALVDEPEGFDADYFGYTPREAELIDPQQRILLEQAVAALENAGRGRPSRHERVGVFAGASMSHYAFNLYSRGGFEGAMSSLRAFLGNSESHLATRISYKLDLRGPSVFVATACSTSLVAVHLACRSLLEHECDLALAGGASITVPHPRGYLFREGGVLSPDGHCRAYDAEANGMIIGNGAGVVVLKRLEEALQDGDPIHAVVLGSAANNDGSGKVGYTAPSLDGQMEVIAEALAFADVDASTIAFVEGHGTGTPLGDPIEVAALTRVYRRYTSAAGYCALGSVKSNFGHLLAAAGVAGLIKVILALREGEIPPSLHFKQPNPKLNLERSPFSVNRRLRRWDAGDLPRRSAVSSFGIGGTNAHVILEQAPPCRPAAQEKAQETARPVVLTLSAQTDTALEALCTRTADELARRQELSVADAAYTLQVGRRPLAKRFTAVTSDRRDAVALLRGEAARGVLRGDPAETSGAVAFVFPGQGTQFPGMGEDLYHAQPVFRSWIDRFAARWLESRGRDLRDLLFFQGRTSDALRLELTSTENAQVALFAVGYALARMWMDWGIRPACLLGHSVGEITAAAVAGVLTPEDAFDVVALRGREMDACPPGGMLAVGLAERDLRALLDDDVTLAAVNTADRCVVSGSVAALDRLDHELRRHGHRSMRLDVSHAFHSPLMQPAADTLRSHLTRYRFKTPEIPFVSNVTGELIQAAQAGDPAYWARQALSLVRFGDGLRRLVQAGITALLELGPDSGLRRNLDRIGGKHIRVLGGFRKGPGSEPLRQLQAALGQLWVDGHPVDFEAVHRDRGRRRVELPTYPFEHRPYWVHERVLSPDGAPTSPAGRSELERWFYLPAWRRTANPAPDTAPNPDPDSLWLLLDEPGGPCDGVSQELARRGLPVRRVRPGDALRLAADDLAVRPDRAEDWQALLRHFADGGLRLRYLLHAWTWRWPQRRYGFDSLLVLAQTLARIGGNEPVTCVLITSALYSIAGEHPVRPAAATAAGICRVLAQEIPGMAVRHVDLRAADAADHARVAQVLIGECLDAGQEPPDTALELPDVVALRGPTRWVRCFERVSAPSVAADQVLRRGGVYLITGGTGGIGSTIAEMLLSRLDARTILLDRTKLPARERWRHALADEALPESTRGKLRRLLELEAAGGEICVVHADVADRSALAAALSQAHERFGHIDGVIHAAGVAGGGMLIRRDLAEADRVLAPKVEGTQNLLELLADDPPELLVLCSSLASIRGGFGQADYCAANTYLDAVAGTESPTRIVSINWGAWAEVGMAVDSVARRGFLPCPFWLEKSSQGRPVAHPFLGQVMNEEADRHALRSELCVEHQWPLQEHRIAGRPTWPGTAYLELVRAAAAAARLVDGPLELSDVSFLVPLTVDPLARAEVYTIFTSAAAKPEDGWNFRVASRVTDGDQVQLVDHARGVARPLANGPPRRVDHRLPSQVPLEATLAPGEPALLDFGPRWNALAGLSTDNGLVLARVRLPDAFHTDLESVQLHPALLDVAFGAAKLHAGDGRPHLPMGYGRIRIYSALPAELGVAIRLRSEPGSQAAVLRFDIEAFDPAGRLLLEVEDYLLRPVDPAAVQLGHFHEAETMESLLQGAIRSAEGVEAFLRALGTDQPQVVVSALPLAEVLRKWRGDGDGLVRSIEQAQLGRTTRQRDELKHPYVAPRTEIERRVAQVWAELLGLDRVGVHDDFFRLGGDSLLGIQVRGRLNQSLAVELPLAALFEQPTVEATAELVAQQLAELADVTGWSSPLGAGADGR